MQDNESWRTGLKTFSLMSVPHSWSPLAGINPLMKLVSLIQHQQQTHSCSVCTTACDFWAFLPTRSAFRSLCRCTASPRCVSWSASEVPLGRRTIFHTACNCTVFLPCAFACAWSASTAAQTSCHSRSSGTAWYRCGDARVSRASPTRQSACHRTSTGRASRLCESSGGPAAQPPSYSSCCSWNKETSSSWNLPQPQSASPPGAFSGASGERSSSDRWSSDRVSPRCVFAGADGAPPDWQIFSHRKCTGRAFPPCEPSGELWGAPFLETSFHTWSRGKASLLSGCGGAAEASRHKGSLYRTPSSCEQPVGFHSHYIAIYLREPLPVRCQGYHSLLCEHKQHKSVYSFLVTKTGSEQLIYDFRTWTEWKRSTWRGLFVFNCYSSFLQINSLL